MRELKRCPFCGGEAELRKHINGRGLEQHYVECLNCDCDMNVSTYSYNTVEEAIKVWNTRNPVDDVVEALEEELKKCEKEWSELNGFHCDRAYERMTGYNHAIEIVKEHLT